MDADTAGSSVALPRFIIEDFFLHQQVSSEETSSTEQDGQTNTELVSAAFIHYMMSLLATDQWFWPGPSGHLSSRGTPGQGPVCWWHNHGWKMSQLVGMRSTDVQPGAQTSTSAWKPRRPSWTSGGSVSGSFIFLGVVLAYNLLWSVNTTAMAKKARQTLPESFREDQDGEKVAGIFLQDCSGLCPNIWTLRVLWKLLGCRQE